MKTTVKGAIITGLAILFAHSISGQDTNLNFNGITATSEGAIQLSWNSTSNEVYRIDYANEIWDTNTDTIVWRTLCDSYPSHGTNTIWLDTGDYNLEPNVPHPRKTETRFYRIATKGTNDGEPPYVVITSPTNNSVLSGQATVSVISTSSMPVINIKLYVDGQEMDRSEDGTNFVINTCEWPNGSHIIFATAKAQSSLSGPNGNFPITIGRAVSSYLNVTFDNLISRVAFTEPFFEPSLGQTQTVTASFAVGVDWTLQMIDEESNAVRTVTGSGISLAYDWDGTGDGGTNIANGVYYYTISVQTNGLTYIQPPATNNPPEDPPQLFGMVLNGYSAAVPLCLYPPGIDTNTMLIVEATEAEISPARPLRQSGLSSLHLVDSGQTYSLGASAAASQSTTAPTRPATAPVKNAVNNFAVGFYDFQTPVTRNIPKNGQPFPLNVHLDDCQNCNAVTSGPIPSAQNNSAGLIQVLKRAGWKLAFQRSYDKLPVQSIRRDDQGIGGGQAFTAATLGFFSSHGSYGTDLDYSPGCGGTYQTYFPSDCPSDGTGNTSWLRLGQFGFGGNLKWMAILACNSLSDPNYGSMASHGAIPLKETHLLCGTTNISWIGDDIGAYWAENMVKKKQTIREAWFNAGVKLYHATEPGMITNTVGFRVTGYSECMDDTIATNTSPSSPSATPRNLVKRDFQVYP